MVSDGSNRVLLKLASFLAILSVLLAGLGTGCARTVAQEQGKGSPSPSPAPLQSPKNGLVQTSSGGGVDISVEWRGLKDGLLVFDVTMDTHSGSLDQYNLGELAVLRDSRGKEYRPSSSDVPPGGHHRSGPLTFLISDPSNPLTAKYFDLILRDIAGVAERDLRWQLN